MSDAGPPFDWRTISRDWQAHDPPPTLVALQPRLRRETRRLAITTALDLAAFVVTTVLIVAVTLARPTGLVIATAAVVIALNLWIATFSILNRRGSWRATTATPLGHVALLRERGRATMRATRFARGAAVAQGIAVVGYVMVNVSNRAAPVLPVALAATLAVVLVMAYLAFARRQEVAAQAMLREADDLDALLRDDEAPPRGGTDDAM